jgi:competence protein ComGF
MITMDNRGFTLLEMLLSFTIFIMIASFIPLFLQLAAFPSEKNKLNLLEWEVFLQQAKIEIREASELEVKDGVLYLKNLYGQNVSYEQYNHSLRRRVDGTGHEILLKNIKSVSFQIVTNGCIVVVTDLNENEFRAKIKSFQPIR